MPSTPFQARLARVHSVEDAKTFLMGALAQGAHEELVGGDYPFDIDLAGLLFPLQNRGIRPDEEETAALSIDELGPLLSDAAWELCLEGLLRPGARSPMDKSTHKSSGYTLTGRGQTVLLERAKTALVA